MIASYTNPLEDYINHSFVFLILHTVVLKKISLSKKRSNLKSNKLGKSNNYFEKLRRVVMIIWELCIKLNKCLVVNIATCCLNSIGIIKLG